MTEHKKTMLILGATSAIARQVARQICQRDIQLILIGRDEKRLQDLVSDISVRGGAALFQVADLDQMSSHQGLINELTIEHGCPDIVFVAYGTLPDQKHCESEQETALKELTTNFLSIQNFISIMANRMEAQRAGTIVVISSVAGDRGRQSNYFYGAAKGALSIYLQGLRNRLAKHNVQVLTVKPGFVDTPMTRDFKKGLLWVGPERVAKDIIRGIDKSKDVIYTPWYWKWIMLVIKSIPERIFKKLSL